MKKNLIAVLLSLTTLLSATCVTYADGDEGWSISYTDGDSDKANRNEYYAKITDESDIEPVQRKEKVVYQFDLKGNLITTFSSATQAAKADGSSVWKVLAGTNNTHKQHIYRYI
jgi:hypothetical protein